MPRKKSYTVLESNEQTTEQTTVVPTKIKTKVKGYKNGGYVWLPKEWREKEVIISVV